MKPVFDLFGIKTIGQLRFSESNPSSVKRGRPFNPIEWPIGPNFIDLDRDRTFQCRPDWLVIHSNA
jgi:hypothetical protein